MHCPNHLRDVFADLVDVIDQTGVIPVTIEYGGQIESTTQFLRRFAGCSDLMPGTLRDSVAELFWQMFGATVSPAAVGTYARAARRIGEVRRESTALVF